jgi:hypothetical protein
MFSIYVLFPTARRSMKMKRGIRRRACRQRTLRPLRTLTFCNIVARYAAPIFATSALQMSKVQMTWDDDDPKRSVLKGDKHGRINYADFLASGSSSDEDGGAGGNSSDDDTSRLRPEKRKAYAALLDALHAEGGGAVQPSGTEMSFADNVQRRAEDVLAAFSGDAKGKGAGKKNKKSDTAGADSLYDDDVEVCACISRIISLRCWGYIPQRQPPPLPPTTTTTTTTTATSSPLLQWDPNDPYHAEELEKVNSVI